MEFTGGSFSEQSDDSRINPTVHLFILYFFINVVYMRTIAWGTRKMFRSLAKRYKLPFRGKTEEERELSLFRAADHLAHMMHYLTAVNLAFVRFLPEIVGAIFVPTLLGRYVPLSDAEKIPLLNDLYTWEISFFVHEILFRIIQYVWYRRSAPRFELTYFAHDVFAICLTAQSWLTLRHMELGLVVFVLHDLVDIFYHLAKMFNEWRHYNFLRNTAFVLFSLTYVINRIILYPRHALTIAVTDDISNACLPLALLLYCVHLWWLVPIMKVFRDLVTGADTHDVREDPAKKKKS